MATFTDPRLRVLNAESGINDDGMRAALVTALEPTETAVAAYNVSAHIWMHAVLTDRALVLVKGAVRAKAIRVPLPVTIVRSPRGTKKGARIATPLGAKTLWGSVRDPDMALLLAARPDEHSSSPRRSAAGECVPGAAPDSPPPPAPAAMLGIGTAQRGSTEATGMSRRQRRAAARQLAGPRPRRPRRQRVRKQWVGFAPAPTVWDLASNCVKCGRPLTDPRSMRARVGTKCIRVYGSQERRIPNPERSAWNAKKAKADADYIAEKVRADAIYARVTEEYERASEAWARIRQDY